MLHLDQDAAGFDLGFEALQIVACGRGFDLAIGEIENRRVLGAFHGVFDHHTARKMNLFVGAKAIGAEIAILMIAIDGEGASTVIEPDRGFSVDVIGGTGVNPGHFLSQTACGA
jgi:hypothetical protein